MPGPRCGRHARPQDRHTGARAPGVHCVEGTLLARRDGLALQPRGAPRSCLCACVPARSAPSRVARFAPPAAAHKLRVREEDPRRFRWRAREDPRPAVAAREEGPYAEHWQSSAPPPLRGAHTLRSLHRGAALHPSPSPCCAPRTRSWRAPRPRCAAPSPAPRRPRPSSPPRRRVKNLFSMSSAPETPRTDAHSSCCRLYVGIWIAKLNAALKGVNPTPVVVNTDSQDASQPPARIELKSEGNQAAGTMLALPPPPQQPPPPAA